MVQGKKGEYQKELSQLRARGFVRAKIDKKEVLLNTPIKLERNIKHDISIYVDRVIIKPSVRSRLLESLQIAIELAEGVVEIERHETAESQFFSTKFGCPKCGFSFKEIEPRSFSFNSQYGACPDCEGLGIKKEAVQALDEDAEEDSIDYFLETPCESCNGARLKKEFLSVHFNEKNIFEISSLNIQKCMDFFTKSLDTKHKEAIAKPILKEIISRLEFLNNVGLSYLTLSRSATTLSGGEAQRIRLASQIGSSLIGVLYILDEPSIGLHPRDNLKLIETMKHLRDNGNTVIVVEHDEETILMADYVVDIGPGAGIHGGQVLLASSPEELVKNKKSLTGQYLAQKNSIPLPKTLRTPKGYIEIKNAKGNNLKNIDVKLPLGNFICITGVSGSGKSTLILNTLYPSVVNFLNKKNEFYLCDSITGLENIDKIIHINQSPIGRTPRSNPATYTGLFGDIRALFANIPEAKAKGYSLGRFSFNVEGGRCENCFGDGSIRVTMNFLPDAYVLCEACQGKRYNPETLDIRYKDKNISDVLNMNIEEAVVFFDKIPNIKAKLQTLLDVGLGYIQIGQNAVTLSGGEAQRIKLAKELNKRATGKTIYILDEPTTGLHFEDVKKLIEILHKLVDSGNTVIVIEHHLDVIKQADYVIDLGPEGGDKGGNIVYQGTPEELSQTESSHTGQFLTKFFQ